jgi:hypothetical protein
MKIDALDFVDLIRRNFEGISRSSEPLWHPLGFVSTVVEQVEGRHTLRLHYWPTNERRTKNPDWPIHTHSYALSSLVLAGSVYDSQYEVEQGSDYSVYEVRYFDGGSQITRTDRSVSIAKTTTRTRQSGEQYRVERGVFHQSLVPIGKSAVTMVALSEIGSDPPLVLGASGDMRYPYDRVPFDRGTFWAAIKAALD